MPGLISLPNSPLGLPATGSPPSVTVGAPSLAVFIDLMTGKTATPAIVAAPTGDERQDDAAPGKSLPPKDTKLDPTLAWLFGAPPPVIPPVAVAASRGAEAAVPAALATAPADPTAYPDSAAPTAEPATAPTAALGIAPIGDMPVLIAALPAMTLTSPTVPAGAPGPLIPAIASPDATRPISLVAGESQPLAVAAPTGPTKAPSLTATTHAQTATVALYMPITATDAPRAPVAIAAADAPHQATQPAPIVVQPPVVPIAVAPLQNPVILPALFALAMLAEGNRAEQDDTPSATPISFALQPATTTLATIAQPGDAQQQSLDMGQRDWPQKMIDHIEALRDNADANDTSIRLKPDALGRVDVALKAHADGAISVRFSAEQPTTRTLIADAAPQLALVAEARGIRLSGTSVDLSGQGGDPRPRPEVERRQPITNHLATTSGDDSEIAADGRVA